VHTWVFPDGRCAGKERICLLQFWERSCSIHVCSASKAVHPKQIRAGSLQGSVLGGERRDASVFLGAAKPLVPGARLAGSSPNCSVAVHAFCRGNPWDSLPGFLSPRRNCVVLPNGADQHQWKNKTRSPGRHLVTASQVAQGGCGCPIPGGIQGQTLGSLVWRLATLHVAGGLKLDDRCGPFQLRPFYESLLLSMRHLHSVHRGHDADCACPGRREQRTAPGAAGGAVRRSACTAGLSSTSCCLQR